MTQGTVQKKKAASATKRLGAETAALRQMFDDPGVYVVTRPDGTTRRLFVLCRRPWRFARIGLHLEARHAAE